ncbi:cyclin-K isoform X3 [Paramisgurnus dabryanus]|uniref:cyclin-K isoform X3 n=1 Tax=Paramisgurnus dabryanus TaxID=90735 RepID=UPI0031F47870
MDGKENSNATSGSFATNLDHTKPCWYWDKKDLARTPSQSDGLDPATEARYRREGARFIFDVGTRLGLHYDTLATGITYFHRFYMFHSFKQFPRYVTGACCLFLAGKVEETPKKCKDIIKTARSLLNDVQFAQFGDDPKEEVMVLERILLQTIKFDLQVEHPYQFLLRYAKQLKDHSRSCFSGDKNKVQKLVQMAWTFVNDSSLCTMLSLQWEPEIIAVAVMYLAGRLCKFDIQEWTSKQSSRRWWEQFVQDVPVELLEDICHQILDLYSQGKQPIPQQPQIQEKEKPPPPPVALPSQSGGQNPPAQPPIKKNSPQASPPAKMKRQHVSPKEEPKAPTEQVGSKIPRLESPMPPLPVSQPPDRKAPSAIPAPPAEAEPATSIDIDPAQGPAPPLPHGAPPPLPHRPPPPPPSSYIMGMSTSSSYMSGEGFQSLQSMMKTEGPSYAPMPPSYGLPYHPHVYPHQNPPGPPPPSTYPPPNLPPPTPSYPPPGYNPSYPPPPPRMPPGHNVPPPVMGLPPAGYPPPPVPPGQPQVPLPPHAMPPVAGMNRGAWMR